MTPHIAAFVRAKLGANPDPPRSVGITEVLQRVLEATSMRVVLGVSLVMALALFTLGAVGRPDDRLVAFCFGALALLGAATPLFYARRLAEAIRIGRRTFAVVESVEYSRAGSRDTLDAISHGIARGKWRVPEAGLVDYEADEPWAKDLAVGVQVEILVAGSTPKAMFPLGLRESSR